MTERILIVFLNDMPAGYLIQEQNGVLSFAYTADYVAQHNMGISLSLPLREEPYTGSIVQAFFSGLLPEEGVRRRLAQYLGVSERNPFALLKAIGGECAGALALYPEGMGPPVHQAIDVEVLDTQKLKEILALLHNRPMLAGDSGLRLSLAGAQDKLAVGFKDGNILLVKGGAPTTHILKPIIEWVKDSAHNELFCMRLAKKVGLLVPEAKLLWVGDMPYYLVARYDRICTEDGTIQRIHQEDMCQATGILPEIKYENEGGPSITTCQQIITSYSAKPAVDQLRLLDMIIFNYLIGNADAHGKNFSLLYHSKKPELAPAYDLLSTAVYPDLSEKMAMKIGGKYNPRDIFLRHWLRLVPETKSAASALTRQLRLLAIKTTETAITVKNELIHEGITSLVINDICFLIQQRAKRIMDEMQ